MRARVPDHEFSIHRDGADIAVDVYDCDDATAPTILLMQTWQIVDARHWKFMIPYLARHYRVVTYDPVGNGRSSRVYDSARYGTGALIDDALAVLDATETGEALVAGLSMGGGLALLFGGLHPDRISGVVAIAAAHPWAEVAPERSASLEKFGSPLDGPEGWDKYNDHYWRTNWSDFVEFFFDECCSDPHSTKLWDDTTEWAMDTDGELIALAAYGPPLDGDQAPVAIEGLTAPVLIVHGTGDRIINSSSALELHRRLPDAELMTIEGAGHLPTARFPVRINLAIKSFADRVFDRRDRPPTVRRRSRTRERALMLSSPIGLGHARRDLAICDELRRLRPGIEIDWLSQDPVTRVLAAADERVHPASAAMANESAHFESVAGEHDLAAFQSLREMDEIQLANFMVADEVITDGSYDLVIGDESWELDHHLHENPALKKTAFAWLTDFVGYLPMPAGGEREAIVAADYNAEMIEHIDDHPNIRDRSIFVGNPDDIVADRFGPGLPSIRDWTEEHYDFAGYVTGFDPSRLGCRDEVRSELGYRPDERICIVSVGGSGVGTDLLRRCAESAPTLRRHVDDLRLVIVTGPRIDPRTLPTIEGVEYRRYVDQLYRHLAVADYAIVQGGLTTTMELAACEVPFIYVPLRNHFEQNLHVKARLDRYRAGRLVEYDDLDPDHVASIITDEIDQAPKVLPVETDGAARAAALIADLL